MTRQYGSALAVWLALTVGQSACESDSKPSDPSGPDGGRSDAGDSGRRDTGSGAIDSGRADSGRSDGGGQQADASGLQPDAAGSDAGTAGCNAAPDVGRLAIEPVPGVGSLERLVFAAQPPGSGDWYLVQQGGIVRVLSGGQLRPGNFLDLSGETGALNDDGDERGLLGLAFAPNYATSGKFYLALTPNAGGDANRDLVLELERSSGDPYLADVATRKVLLRLEPSAGNHNGGHVAFGPDGMLYVGTGDGGGGCNDDKRGAPQDVASLFGKILRLDPNAQEPPFAASGNPFAAGGDARVLHYGLRNPYRFNFDRATGDLYVGDVGQNAYEELDRAPQAASGLNFGWAKYEGRHADTCAGFSLRPEGATHTPPIDEVDQRMDATGPFADWVSVIAGVTYRGAALTQLQGVHLYGDYDGDRMRAFRQCGSQTSPITAVNKNCNPNAPAEACLGKRDGAPSTFNFLTAIVEDGAGEIYFVANRNTLLKLVVRP